MNKDRRKAINVQYYALKAVLDKISAAHAELPAVLSAIEELRDEEQEAFDNMLEGLQGSEKGEVSQQAIDYLSTAADTLTAWDLQNILDEGEEALEALDNAESGN